MTDFWGDEQFAFFESILFLALGRDVEVIGTQLLSGGGINTAAQVFSSEGVFFVKWNHHDEQRDMFEMEARGLDLLRQTETFAVPEVIGFGEQQGRTYLILEYLDSGAPAPDYWEQFGQSLALLHAQTQPKFGLHFDNYIGSLPQTNTPNADGFAFFFEQRILSQAGLALYNELLDRPLYDKILTLRDRLSDLLPNDRPALLHGDLWSQNVIVQEQSGLPALVDPAVHYGFREAEIAFTKLFGGFDQAFYDAYDEAFPLDAGFDERVPIYNLYPLLVHTNLFGTGYLAGVEKVLRRF